MEKQGSRKRDGTRPGRKICRTGRFAGQKDSNRKLAGQEDSPKAGVALEFRTAGTRRTGTMENRNYGRLPLHGLGVELEVTRKDDRIHRFLKICDTFRTSLLTHLAAFFLGRQNLFLSDHGGADCAQQHAHDDNDCFFHST